MAYLRWPATIISVFWVLCVQVVIVCTWQLLTLVDKDRIFSEAAFGWVNGILGAIAAAWLVLLGVLLYVGFNADDPGLPLLLFLLATGVTVLGLLMIVMRALLRQATTLRSDLEGVI
jgi:acyl-coenzyme A synthetase/AMP-(fatty) acid ligase